MGIITHPAHSKLAQAFQAVVCCPLFTRFPKEGGWGVCALEWVRTQALQGRCACCGSRCHSVLGVCWVCAGKSTKALCASVSLLQNGDDLLPTWGIAVHPDEAVQVLEEVF